MSVPAALPHADAILVSLAAAGLTVFLGGAPQGPEPAPYAVVYPQAGIPTPGSLCDDVSDVIVEWQVTCVGASAEQALWVADKATAALCSGPLLVSGRTGRRPEVLTAPPVQRDDDVSPPLYYQPVVFRVYSTPA